jgi:hypothetical protein
MRQGARDFGKLPASRKSAPEVLWGVLVGRYCPNKREVGTDKLFHRETRKTILIRTGTWCWHPRRVRARFPTRHRTSSKDLEIARKQRT